MSKDSDIKAPNLLDASKIKAKPINEPIALKLSYVPRQKNKKDQARLQYELEKIIAKNPPKCYYCDFKKFKNKEDYQKHVLTRHKDMLCYPGLSDLCILGIRAQSMSWEI